RCPHLLLEVAFGGLVGHVDASAVDGELPAVVDAADASLLVAAEEQRGAAVGAVVLNQADLARGVAVADQIFAEQPYAQWVAVRPRQFVGADRRQPVLAHEIAHRRAGANPTQVLVLRLAEHADNGRPSCWGVPWLRHAGSPIGGTPNPPLGSPRWSP